MGPKWMTSLDSSSDARRLGLSESGEGWGAVTRQGCPLAIFVCPGSDDSWGDGKRAISLCVDVKMPSDLSSGAGCDVYTRGSAWHLTGGW